MNFRIVAYILSKLILACCVIMLLPLICSVFEAEGNRNAFIESLGGALALGAILYSYGRNSGDTMNVREGIAVTGLGWLLSVVTCMIPFWAGGYLSLLNSFFEAMSGLGCMGATVITHIDEMPKSILLWRSLIHWIGGLGIVVVFIALLPQFGHGMVHMLNAESSGDRERLVPRLKSMAVSLFKIYLGFTVSAAIIYYLCGMYYFDAILHAFATIATGGFSTHDASVAYFQSPVIEAWMVFFMILSSLNFNMYIQVAHHGLKTLKRHTEFKVYLSVLSIFILMITANLMSQLDLDFFSAFREAAFQTVSLSSSTGFVATDYERWPAFSHFCLLFLMMMGGCAGSTSGGLKVSRVVILFKGVYAELWQRLHPQALYSITINGNPVGRDKLFMVGRYFFVYIMLCVLWSVLLLADGMTARDAIGASISAMSGIGPAFGQVGATSTFADLPNFSKFVICFGILLGRLEIFTILSMLNPEFWHKNKSW